MRGKALISLGGVFAHPLGPALAILDPLDTGEALMTAARVFPKSRGPHLRADYTFTNPLLGKRFLNVFLRNGDITTTWHKRIMD